ncbi:EXT1C protein, partial [Fregetta grallaria]|nr:EXT1C protein [Fregetta grallaria]
MQTRKKYIFLTFLASWLLLFSFGGDQLRRFAFFSGRKAEARRNWPHWTDRSLLKSFADPKELQSDGDPSLPSPRARRAARLSVYKNSRCRMETCFDFSRCEKHGFKVFTYPRERDQPLSESYGKILTSIERSRYYTLNPEEACLFILSIDTLDRDHLSGQYVRNRGWLYQDSFQPKKKYLLVFKGKRYLTGIGSGTRNALHHIHNGKDIISLTTCKHGKDWEKHKDTRCDKDNVDYEKWQSHSILGLGVSLGMAWRSQRQGNPAGGAGGAEVRNQLPCPPPQVPSAVRCIHSERVLAFQQQTQFLWDAYFSSVDKIVHTTLEIIKDRLLPHRSRSRFLWNTLPGGLLTLPDFSTHPGDFPFYYLQHGSSPSEKFTAFIRAVSLTSSPSQPILRLIQAVSGSQYCAQILVLWSCEKPPPPSGKWPQTAVPLTIIQGRRKLSDRFFPYTAIQTDAVLSLDEHTSLSTSEVDFAFVVWRSFPERIVGFPTRSHFWDAEQRRWGYTSKWTNELSIVLTAAAFYHRYPAAEGPAGRGARPHPAPPPCSLPRYYHNLFTEYLPAGLRELVDGLTACEDILMNVLVATVTKLPPIKVTQQKQHKETVPQQVGCKRGDAGTPPAGERSPSPLRSPPAKVKGTAGAAGSRCFSQRQDCLNQLVDWFGYMPLVSSQLRLDPVLFKDQVSVLRKKYPRLEKS